MYIYIHIHTYIYRPYYAKGYVGSIHLTAVIIALIPPETAVA